MTPEFLFVQAEGGAADPLEGLAAAVRSTGGAFLAGRSAPDVAQLEPGTPEAAIAVARWGSSEAFDEAWAAGVAHALDAVGGRVTALAVPGLPDEGLPDAMEIPTIASVPAVPDPAPTAYMTIQGSVTDQEQIAGYRDIILPMMKELGSYYVVFAIEEGAVRVLRGSWGEQIFAISVWPTHDAAANGFWYSDRYQKEAVPIRADIGAFRVHLLEGRTAAAA